MEMLEHTRFISNLGNCTKFWRNNQSIRTIVGLSASTSPEVFLLLRKIEETLPFTGGIRPKTYFKTTRVSFVEEQDIVSFDGRLLLQFLNMSVYLQNKLAGEIGSTKQILFAKIAEIVGII